MLGDSRTKRHVQDISLDMCMPNYVSGAQMTGLEIMSYISRSIIALDNNPQNWEGGMIGDVTFYVLKRTDENAKTAKARYIILLWRGQETWTCDMTEEQARVYTHR